jgi:hypothetical protein
LFEALTIKIALILFGALTIEIFSNLVWKNEMQAPCQLERLLQSFFRALTIKIASILFREMRLKFQYVSLRDCDFLWCRNYNYGAASAKVGANILAQPYLVSQDPILAFKSSLYFWTSGSDTIPSIHEVLIGKWKPSTADQEAGRKPGFGVTIDIINGGLECGKVTPQAQNRVKYFKQFCKQLNVSTGPNLSCATMQPF